MEQVIPLPGGIGAGLQGARCHWLYYTMAGRFSEQMICRPVWKWPLFR